MLKLLPLVILLSGCASLGPKEPHNPLRGIEGVERLSDDQLWKYYVIRQMLLLQSPYYHNQKKTRKRQ